MSEVWRPNQQQSRHKTKSRLVILYYIKSISLIQDDFSIKKYSKIPLWILDMGVSNALCGHFNTLNELKSTIEYYFYGGHERCKSSQFNNLKKGLTSNSR